MSFVRWVLYDNQGYVFGFLISGLIGYIIGLLHIHVIDQKARKRRRR